MRRVLFVLAVLLALSPTFLLSQTSSGIARHVYYGPTFPAACNPATGDIFFRTSAGPVGTMYTCNAPNTWSGVGTTGVSNLQTNLAGPATTSGAINISSLSLDSAHLNSLFAICYTGTGFSGGLVTGNLTPLSCSITSRTTSSVTVTFASSSNVLIILSSNGGAGPQGTQGIQGNPGSPGAPGTAATVSVGTTTTGAPGSSASVTNSGSTSAAVFNFTIPRGDTGAGGPPGPAGNTNMPGATFAAPPTPTVGATYWFTDASSDGVCTGGGTGKASCRWNGTGWDAVGGGAGTPTGGIQSLDGLTATTQTFSLANSGTDPAWSTSGTDTHVLQIPDANIPTTNRGLLSYSDWSLFNSKEDGVPGCATDGANGWTCTGKITASEFHTPPGGPLIISGLESALPFACSGVPCIGADSATHQTGYQNAAGSIVGWMIDPTTLGYLGGLSSNVQTQLNNLNTSKASATASITINGVNCQLSGTCATTSPCRIAVQFQGADIANGKNSIGTADASCTLNTIRIIADSAVNATFDIQRVAQGSWTGTGTGTSIIGTGTKPVITGATKAYGTAGQAIGTGGAGYLGWTSVTINAGDAIEVFLSGVTVGSATKVLLVASGIR